MMSLPSLQETLEYQVLVVLHGGARAGSTASFGFCLDVSGFSVPGRFVVVGVGAGIYKTVSCRGGGDVQTDRQTDYHQRTIIISHIISRNHKSYQDLHTTLQSPHYKIPSTLIYNSTLHTTTTKYFTMGAVVSCVCFLHF